MTEPTGQPMGEPTAPPMSPPPSPPTSAGSTMNSTMASFSQAELFIAAGAALIVLTDLYSIFIAYGVSNVVWVAAAVALIVLFIKGRMPAMVSANKSSILILVAAIVVLLALRQVLVDIRFIATPPAGLSVERLIGMVGFYAGAALIAIGGWRMWRAA